MPAILATGGHVLTPASRDATAFAYEDGMIVWAGADAPGPTLFPDAHYVDLNGDWVAPAFVECLPGPVPDELLDAAGVVSAALPDPHGVEDISERVAAGARVVLGPDIDPTDASTELARLAAEFGGPTVARCTPTFIGVCGLGDDVLTTLAGVGAVLVLRPLVDDLAGTDLVRLAAAGIVLATSSRVGDDIRPWEAMRALTHNDDERGLSLRAAFTSATRGARRGAGARDGTSGTLSPGAPATYARWATGELVRVAADDSVRRWSTDPRSGVPPMPDLDGPDPELRLLVVDGVTR